MRLNLLLHHRFERIHPFRDGDSRLGRILSNQQIQTSIDPRARLVADAKGETKERYLMAMRKTGRRSNLWPLMTFVADQINQSLKQKIYSKAVVESYCQLRNELSLNDFEV